MSRRAFVYYAHDLSPVRKREVKRLEQELPEDYDLFVTGCCDQSGRLQDLAGSRATICEYLRDDLKSLPYPGRHATTRWSDIRGGEDLTLMKFWRDHPDYDYYWFVEYDVRFTGHWENLLSVLDGSDAALVCSLVTRYKPDSGWPHWASFLDPSAQIAPADMMSGFLPVCRASSSLLTAVDEFCAAGGAGHVEVTWATVAKSKGMTIEEIGGNSPFTPPERRGRFYGFADIPGVGRIGNFGAWPFFSDRSAFLHRKKDLLWHPVKD